jgi:hypothetical protein
LAYSAVNGDIKNIIKTQNSTGDWKRKDSGRISFWLLKALKHSGHLDILLKENRFRYDPFLPYRNNNDFYSLVVRKDIMNAPLEGDAELCRKIAEDIFSKQEEDGSRNGTVISACEMLENLLMLDIEINNPRLRRGADRLLGTCVKDVIRNSGNIGGVVAAHNMFTTGVRMDEFKSATEEKPEWLPRQLCYNHLPMIQTGAAIKTLILLGLENDERVISACENLIKMKETYGGWCDTNVRNALIKGISINDK